ncbi:hypothetical protein EOW77_0018080 [Bradyrhizobium yuanmingense]|uniref:hypothetical protein n=1 Tax=Bradyrhizobium yuanmingense TaxID=108015 RepID=UPI000FE3FFA1|nr:hypothetical protein [Bradyrhizobium yuanmingense]TGN86534.1 hypothetical protein EOW77_0018080 [Bradyrhizobium yuanmingense]
MNRLVSLALPLLSISLSSPTEARSCEHTMCRPVEIVCSASSCGRDALAATIPDEAGSLQMAANHKPPLAYFLDELPIDFDLSQLPKGAKEIVIARARALDIPVWLGKRDQSGVVPSRDKSFVRLQVLEVRRGSAALGTTYDVYFGQWDREMIYPLTPDQLARDYVVIMYFDPTDERHRLVGFPISSAQHRDWMSKRSEYWRSGYRK